MNLNNKKNALVKITLLTPTPNYSSIIKQTEWFRVTQWHFDSQAAVAMLCTRVGKLYLIGILFNHWSSFVFQWALVTSRMSYLNHSLARKTKICPAFHRYLISFPFSEGLAHKKYQLYKFNILLYVSLCKYLKDFSKLVIEF